MLTEDKLRCIYCGTTKRRKDLMIKKGLDKYCSNINDELTQCSFQDIHISDLKNELNTFLILSKVDKITENKIKQHFQVCFMEDD